MGAADYREAWAWAHFLLQGPPEARKVLLDHLQQLRTTTRPGPLAPKLAEALGEPDKLLANHVNRLLATPPQVGLSPLRPG
jgi:hypothetical protein